MIKVLVQLGKPYWKQVLIAMGVLSIGLTLRLVSPLIMKRIIDQALIQKETSALRLVPLLVIIMLLPALLYSLANYSTGWIGQRIAAALRRRIFSNLLRQDMRFFEDARTGELVVDVMRQGANVALSQTGLHLPELVREVPTIIASLAIMLAMNARLAIIAIAVFPLFFLPIRRLGAQGAKLGQEYVKQMNRMVNLVQETISGIRLVVAMNRESRRLEELDEGNKELVRMWARIAALDALNEMWFSQILQAVGIAIVFGAGSFAVVNGELTVGGLVAFMSYVPLLYAALSTLTRTKLEWDKNRYAFQRVLNYIEIEPNVKDRPGAQPLNTVEGRIQFEDVTFRYPSRTESALNNVSLCMEPGQCVALVGPSGSGKSTVVDLLLRFYDPASGCIRIDGKDIRDITLASLRDSIALVPQETFLFHDTVMANVRFGSESASVTEVKAAAKDAQIHEFVMSLPQGYETLLGERGVKVSGGERQRLAIARALLRKAPILILDEATSSVDSVTEMEFRKALNKLAGQCTTIVIAHRLATIVDADRIYVFDRGRIVEEGTHEELLRSGQMYAQLYHAQLDVEQDNTD